MKKRYQFTAFNHNMFACPWTLFIDVLNCKAFFFFFLGGGGGCKNAFSGGGGGGELSLTKFSTGLL